MNFSRYRSICNSDQTDSWLLERQLAETAKGGRASRIGNYINGAILAWVFWGTVNSWLLLAAFAGLAVLMVWRAIVLIKATTDDTTHSNRRSLARQVDFNAGLSGFYWGSGIGLLFLVASPSQAFLLGIVGAGMMSAGTFSYRARRNAALLYVAGNLPGVLLGLLSLNNTVGYAAAGLLFCFVAVLAAHAKSMVDGFNLANLRERELETSAATIKLLLNDFTEQGSDWLIEIDRQGCIANPTDRLAEACRRPRETLDGLPFTELFDAGRETETLAGHIANRRAFRHEIASLTVDGKKYWWSISARPLADPAIAWRGFATDITAQREAEHRVSYMAHYDALTDLPNRFLFNDRLNHALHRDTAQVGLMYLDLDHFKSINDTLGHPVGDQLLKAVAERLLTCVSKRELVARLGGDEFAIMVSGARLAQIDRIATKIVSELGKPFALGDHDVVTCTSIGIAQAPTDGTDAEELCRNADLALYAAKSAGRNRSIRFEPGMDEAAQNRRLVEMDLRASLGKDEMRLHYQPLIDIQTGETNGYEALIRWEHPERGIVMPNVFIPVAEETGMILQLGEWVIRQALDDLKTWPEHIGVSINLSPSQMRSPTLISTVINALARTGVDSERVCLEITETVLMQDSDANIQTLYKLRDLGLQIALDDFGTGYSSLNYLRAFPFSKIKIDRCFVSEIDSREDCQAIVRSVVSLADSLGMKTTAEGVEREEQAEILRSEGCGEVQGYLYSKAVPGEQLSNLRAPKPIPASGLKHLIGKQGDCGETARKAA